MIVQLEPGDEGWLESFLVRHAASSMYLRSNARRGGLAYAGRPYQATWAASVDGDAITGVAAHAWSGNVLLQAPRHAAELVRAVLGMSGRPLAGLMGPTVQVEAARGAVAMGKPHFDAREDLFELRLERLLVPEALRSGAVGVRRAHRHDLDLLAAWRREYRMETLGEVVTEERMSLVREEVSRLTKDGEMFVLEAGRPLSCSAFSARLPDLVQVGGVWTPPDGRGRGYARACVAGSLLAAREEGVTRSILFTPVYNAAARRAYEAIGYRAVGDYSLVFW